MNRLQGTERRGGYLFNIRPCTEIEALEILQDRSVVSKLSFYPVGLKNVESHLINDKALLIVMHEGEFAEVHIACKFRDRAQIRQGLCDGIEWMRWRGFKGIFTTANNGRAALVNMLKSLGFTQDSERWVLSWE